MTKKPSRDIWHFWCCSPLQYATRQIIKPTSKFFYTNDFIERPQEITQQKQSKVFCWVTVKRRTPAIKEMGKRGQGGLWCGWGYSLHVSPQGAEAIEWEWVIAISVSRCKTEALNTGVNSCLHPRENGKHNRGGFVSCFLSFTSKNSLF